MKNMRTVPAASHTLRFAFILVALLLSQRGADILAGPKERANEIMEASGVKGGLISHLGCGDGQLTAALLTNDRMLVHGLDADRDDVAKARDHIHGLGLYGKVTVASFDGKRLPYTENLVNLIVSEEPGGVTMKEMFRVLVPGGVVCERQGGGWKKTVKPWPKTIDEWTHFLHGPDNNAVARDATVNIPRSIQWVTGPRWGRTHEEMASLSAAVTANGRIYYIVDEATLTSIRFSSKWRLIARDAFNGVLLWKHDILSWTDHLRHFRSGPAHLPRRLVAADNVVYVTSGLSSPLLALDGATGEKLREYEGTDRTEEILLHEGILYLVVGTSEVNRVGVGLKRRGEPEPTSDRYITAIVADSGSQLWRKNVSEEGILPLTLALSGERLNYQSTASVVSLNTTTGEELWKTPRQTPEKRMGFSAPTLVATRDVILCADRDVGKNDQNKPSAGKTVWGVSGWNQKGFARKGACTLVAYDSSSGKELWSAKCGEGYNSPVDIFVVNGVVWAGPRYQQGLDLKTGKVVKQISTKAPRVGMPHHRCYRNKASERFIFTGKSGIEVLSLDKGWLSNNSWVRGTCQYGIIPANGLIYAPPDACACFLTVKAPGFFAMAPQKRAGLRMPFPKTPVIEKGKATSGADAPRQLSDLVAERQDHDEDEWPMYRHDSRRSGTVSSPVPEFPAQRWSDTVGGRLTQPSIYRGKVFVASTDEHTVHALSADDGRKLWRFTTGGRIDSTPTAFRNTVIFGSADGWVYCVSAEDGSLVWRFRAAPEDRLVSVHGQLESSWPVHGSVLLQNDTLYVTAGRSTYVDGGIVLYRLDPQTGKQLSRTMLHHLDEETGAQLVSEGRFNMEGTTSDLLTGNGDRVFLKYFTFDRAGKRTETAEPRLFSITGFLGEEWFVRSYWIIGTQIAAGWGGWANAANLYPSGRILCFDEERAYGYGRRRVAGGAAGHRSDAYHLFSSNLKPEEAPDRKGRKRPAKPKPHWADTNSIMVRAMILGKEHIAVAGPLDAGKKEQSILAFTDEEDAVERFEGRKGVLLRIVRATDGRRISEVSLSSVPVFDGMAAAKGRLYLSMRDGKLLCFESGEGKPLPEDASKSVMSGEALVSTPTRSKSTRTATPPKLKGPDKRKDFQHVEAAGVTSSPLGYRLASENKKVGLAIKLLEAPLKKRVVLKVKMQRATEYRYPNFFENAFVAFGDGPKDKDLIKCGIKFVQGSAVILAGPTNGPAEGMERLELDKASPIEVEVSADLEGRIVTLTAGGKTIEVKLKRPLKSITHAGYTTTNAVSDFSPIRIEGE
ncbi:MAG: PQQ-binding-like beta-propeller repeat protein [Planctomycetota bacterium]|nr:PQQ-binding-like beta-propeller repeat protein [Planctomycetota bacterium]